ncbi:spindle and centriole-associated protein 1 [Acipenser ruthenus]|uniref:spindle and centriole-associated protein 1 n=1 Tax=Acipenser ruthenus TaxID=7906 RepID=UPI00145B441F|nr:spindle and centriole-associated protein 1 [Acipenser ruthenus]XP_033864546.3 spindle and centriole-associated protein 1 [Acipenser ruthenus]
MSFLKVNRSYHPHGLGKRAVKVKRKPASKQEWVSTVNDLSVHRATPEELSQRHERHKSKNKAVAQWELREKVLQRRLRKQGQDSPDPLERMKLAIMREVLSEQYHMQDVLERSDRAMAVVKDIFGDAPRRQTGFPNVTMAPDCDPDSSVLPVVQKQHLPTQLSILSESVMDSQALNEVEDESLYLRDSERSEDEVDASDSVTFNSNMDMSRYSRYLQEKAPRCERPTNENPPETPCTPHTPATSLGNQEAALNATTAVKRVRSRRHNEEGSCTPLNGSSSTRPSKMIGQVLNPDPKNQKRGKKSKHSSSSSRSRAELPELDSTALGSLSGNQSSLELLHHMMGEVELDLQDFEQQTGREVNECTTLPRAQGLTGFSVSLVSTLSRLVRLLKESGIQLNRESEARQRLAEESQEQRTLIDVLTAEVLTIREENAAMQAKLQQYMIVADEQLISLKQELNELTGRTDNERFSARPVNSSVPANAAISQEHRPASRGMPYCGVDRLDPAPSDYPERDIDSPLKAGAGKPLPERLFQPAVLLSPPRQRDSQTQLPTKAVVRNVFQENQRLNISKPNNSALYPETLVPAMNPLVGELHPNNWPPAEEQRGLGETRLQMQQWKGGNPEDELEECSMASSFTSLPQANPLQKVGLHRPDSLASPPSKTQGSQHSVTVFQAAKQKPGSVSADEEKKQEMLMSHIAELTRQNSIIKAQLGQFRAQPEGAGKSSQQATETHKTGAVTEPGTDAISRKSPLPSSSPGSVEQRIAELNRQSVEARSKLLELIEQQKQAAGAASPSVSPIPPAQGRWSTGNGGRTIEVSIPLPDMDSSAWTTPSSSVSRTSGRRSAGEAARSCSPLSDGRATPVSTRAKVDTLKEEGWFALSTHVK